MRWGKVNDSMLRSIDFKLLFFVKSNNIEFYDFQVYFPFQGKINILNIIFPLSTLIEKLVVHLSTTPHLGCS